MKIEDGVTHRITLEGGTSKLLKSVARECKISLSRLINDIIEEYEDMKLAEKAYERKATSTGLVPMSEAWKPQ